LLFFFSSRRRHTRCYRDWSSDVCSSDLKSPDHGCLSVRGRSAKWRATAVMSTAATRSAVNGPVRPLPLTARMLPAASTRTRSGGSAPIATASEAPAPPVTVAATGARLASGRSCATYGARPIRRAWRGAAAEALPRGRGARLRRRGRPAGELVAHDASAAVERGGEMADGGDARRPEHLVPGERVAAQPVLLDEQRVVSEAHDERAVLGRER